MTLLNQAGKPVIIRYTHKWEGRQTEMAVIEANKGKHRNNCLCFQQCAKFLPGDARNCAIAAMLYHFATVHDVVTPVWECSQYIAKTA